MAHKRDANARWRKVPTLIGIVKKSLTISRMLAAACSTMADVARAAGVSPTTVSQSVGDRFHVRPGRRPTVARSRLLSVVDEFTREALVMRAAHSITADHTVTELAQARALRQRAGHS